ncbi:terminase large subunit [Pseudanabaena phage Pan5]|nr:terminase large subunit [Pseudanabaena phage Pan5]
MNETEVILPKRLFLPVYHHLLDEATTYDIEFLYGGRDSGKSRFTAQRLIYLCLHLPYFRCILTRKVKDTIKDSQWQLIKDICEEWKIDHLFKFKSSPLGIECINGNSFICRGLDQPTKLKSVSNPSHCWVEEGNQIEREDFTIILTSLRYNGGNVQTFFTFNPECETTYTEFWLWQDWFSRTTDLSFTYCQDIYVNGEKFTYRVRATHSTYKNNPYCSPQRIALYESYKNSKNNAYWYQTYTLGLWGYRKTGGEFWKCFDEGKHTRVVKYQPNPIHVVVDNNVMPYVTVDIWQLSIEKKEINQVAELNCTHPDNTAKKAALRLVKWVIRNDVPHVYLYGDPSANSRSTVDDDGRSFFDKFIAVLRESGIEFTNRIQKSHPSVAMSKDFINEIYEAGYEGWKISIDTDCRVSIEDYTMVKEDIDGTMLKKKITDKDTKVSYEKYGHHSDNKRYLITTILAPQFRKFASRRKRTGSVSVPG